LANKFKFGNDSKSNFNFGQVKNFFRFVFFYFLRALHGVQQKFCKMKWPLLFLASKTELQLWDVTTKLLFSSGIPNGTATMLHLLWIPDAARAVGIFLFFIFLTR
jgi:hypothetical protein